MSQFSNDLIERVQTYYRTHCHVEISESDAEEFLNGFADLWLSLAAVPRPAIAESRARGGG